MVTKHKNRWLRRWLVVIIFWAVPVAIVAVSEIREEMAYNAVDLDRALTTWNFTDAQRAAGAPARCHGKPDEAQAAGCPPTYWPPTRRASKTPAMNTAYVALPSWLTSGMRSSATGSCRLSRCSSSAC